MIRMTDMIRNRRRPAKPETPLARRLDEARSQDIAKLYSSRVWL